MSRNAIVAGVRRIGLTAASRSHLAQLTVIEELFRVAL